MMSFSRLSLIFRSSWVAQASQAPGSRSRVLPLLVAPLLVAPLLLLMSACGGGAPKEANSAGSNSGKVVERAEGYSERPGWADENRPWSRNDSQIRVIGYVAIKGDQRMEAGYRAADSYARAELMRFLSVRVVAILEDRVATGEPELLRESIEETAMGVIDELPVSGRYYERRKGGSEETLHIFSRIDLDQATVLSLLERAAGSNADLRTTPEELLAQLKERWERVADVDELNQDETLLPNGFPRPKWAEKGDRSDDVGFEFVCSGIAENPNSAKAVAQARCNEKLCRLFGVQITAKTTVTEDLDGIEAQSQVTEQCAEVRVEGRETRYQSSECGPQGCVHWYLQSYPKSAYLSERKRLDQPQIIRQEVVIQEGGKRYRDPEACEKSLRAYGQVQAQSSAGFIDRKKHLNDALKYCQGIDGRESGLFLSLNTLLVKPIPRFTHEKPNSYGGQIDSRWAFSIVSREWQDELDTKRFLTDRIQAVSGVVDGAILALRFIEMRNEGASSQEVDKAFQELLQYPFTNKPVSEHHLYNIHEAALLLAKQKKAAYSKRYRGYLLEQISRNQVECSWKHTISGESVIAYLGADGELDDEEWRASIRILKNRVPDEASYCFGELIKKQNHSGKTAQRVDELAGMIASGTIGAKDAYSSFERLLDQMEKEDRAKIYFRYVAKLSGSEKSRKALAENVTKASFGWDWDYQNKDPAKGIRVCESLPQRMNSYFEDVPDARTEDTALCLCLKLDGVSKESRKGITALLFKYADEKCAWIQGEDWPGTYYQKETPKTIPYQGRSPFSGYFEFIEKEAKSCIEENTVIKSPHMVTDLTATLNGDRMSAAQADTTIYGELKDFEYKDDRRGFVQAEEVLKMEKNIERCLAQAANGFVVPSVWSITKQPGTHRLWFQLWDARTGTNGFVADRKN